jgi:hypothetical protein
MAIPIDIEDKEDQLVVGDNHRCLCKFNIDFIANANQRFLKKTVLFIIYNDADVTDV